MKTVGQILLIARNSKNLSISDISIELKISKSNIIDLENDNIKNNPDIIFNIGHLRSYSNFLELDTDTIIKKFKDEVSFNPGEEKKNITPIAENNFFKIENKISCFLKVLGFSIPSFSACEISSAGVCFFSSCKFIMIVVVEVSNTNIVN